MTNHGSRKNTPAPTEDFRSGRDADFAMSRECFTGIYTSIKEGMAYTDPVGTIVRANPAFCDLLGYTEKELVGRTMLSITPEGEREEEAKTILAFINGGATSGELEKEFIHHDGHTVPVRVNFWLNRNDSGEPLGMWGLVYDLSGQREFEKQVSMTMEQYRFLADNSEDVIWALNGRLEYIYVSPSVERLRGYVPEELLGANIAESMTPESFRAVQKAIRNTQDISSTDDDILADQLVLQFNHKDGSSFWAEVMAKGMRDKEGNWLGVVGSTRDITARKKVEEKLKTNEEYLNALVSATKDSVGLYTPEGTILTVNARLAKTLDSDPEEVAGQSVFDFVPDEFEAQARDLFAEAVSTKEPVNKEVVWAGRLMEANIYPIVGEGGSVSALASYMRDVTDVRMAERERRKTQEQYRLIVETANEGILGLDANQRITYANDIIADLFGYDVSEIIGRPITDFIEPSELEENNKRLAQRKQGDKDRYERQFVRKDGSHVWGLVSASPLIGDDGSFLGVFAMIADITEVKQAHERMLTILNGMDADIYVSDLDTHDILFMNDHMRGKYGTFEPGAKCHTHLRKHDEPCPFCRKPELLDEHGRPVGTVVDERYHEGVKRWHLTHDRAIEWLEGKIVHMYLAADITELKNMEDELKQAIIEAEAANLSKNEFLANMSHEIRTPLNGLLGMLQLMELTSLEPLQREYLTTAHESGRNLLKILNDILDLSKVESGKLELEESDFELGQLLDSVLSVFRHQAKMRGISMSWTIDESLQRYFVADKGRLRQILFNLVGNAAKFTQSGSITLEAYPLESGRRPDSELILFVVQDTGIGIPHDKIDSVFDPFTQVDGSLTRKYQGTGLGLGIVHRLVQLMNGTITISSKEGAGTTIAFTIRAKPLRGKKPGETAPLYKAGGTSLRILVAEDERVNRVVIDRILNKLGHETTCVASGEEALDILKGHSFDLIMTDIQMPGMDGVDTALAIRNQLNIDTPIIALTAHAMKDDRDRFLKSGMDGYIAKPFELNELQVEIDRVMIQASEKDIS
jgi:PAS domain S-box-containing protein